MHEATCVLVDVRRISGVTLVLFCLTPSPTTFMTPDVRTLETRTKYIQVRTAVLFVCLLVGLSPATELVHIHCVQFFGCKAFYTSEESCQIQFIFTRGSGRSVPHKGREDLPQISLEDGASWLIYGGRLFFLNFLPHKEAFTSKEESHTHPHCCLTLEPDTILPKQLKNPDVQV